MRPAASRPAGRAGRDAPRANGDGAIVRVLIADDNKEIRSALTLVLNELWPHCEVAEACHGADVPATVEGWQPDLVLLDWDLDGGPAGHVVDHLKSRYPASAVVAMSSRPEGRDESLLAGATAFVGTSDPPERLFELLVRLGGA
jgi:CheY-like chemotaxis protein